MVKENDYKNKLYSFHNTYCEKTSTGYPPKQEVKEEEIIFNSNRTDSLIKAVYKMGDSWNVSIQDVLIESELVRVVYTNKNKDTKYLTDDLFISPQQFLKENKKQLELILDTKTFNHLYY